MFRPDNPIPRGSFIPDRPVRPLQGQPEALIDIDREGLATRGLKQFANILPETAKETLYGLSLIHI